MNSIIEKNYKTPSNTFSFIDKVNSESYTDEKVMSESKFIDRFIKFLHMVKKFNISYIYYSLVSCDVTTKAPKKASIDLQY